MKNSKIYCFLVLAAVFFTSCVKSKETKIEGMWQRVNVTSQSDSEMEPSIWEFKDGKINLHHSQELGAPMAEGTYKLSFKGKNYRLTIDGLDDTYPGLRSQGEAKVVRLNDDILTFFNAETNMYFEFTRQ